MTNHQEEKQEKASTCLRRRPSEAIITQEGYLYISLSLLLSLGIGFVFGLWIGILGLSIPLYIAYFFRNPKRSIPLEANLILAPADGKILEIEECEEERYLKARAKRISIFMSPFNCHINRAPISAKVIDCFYRKGTFKAAYLPKAMVNNEHHAVLLEDGRGAQWLVVQIAGWLARRIVSYVQGGDQLDQGDRFGLIQFGSRADLYCPLDCQILVKPGQKVYAGKTILGKIS